MKPEKTKVQLFLAPDARRALRILAAEQGTTMSALVEHWALTDGKTKGEQK